MPNTLKRRRRPIEELEDLWPRYVIAPDQMLCYTGRWAEHGINGGGVYFLWGKDNELLYVGTTCDLAARLLAHHRAGKIPYLAYSFLEVEAHPLFNLAEWIEGAYIGALEPPYNYRPGRCAFLGKKLMLERINAAWEACRYCPEHASDH